MDVINGDITAEDMRTSHVWVCGMMHVDPEDVEGVAEMRALINASLPKCEACEDTYPSRRLCPARPESNGAA